MRVLFTAQDSQTIRDAFGRAKPNSEYARLYAPLSSHADRPTRSTTCHSTRPSSWVRVRRRVIGVGRVKTPTMAIVCRRELEIRNFVPTAYFEIVATAKVTGGQFQMRHAPQDRIILRRGAEDVVNAARDFSALHRACRG